MVPFNTKDETFKIAENFQRNPDFFQKRTKYDPKTRSGLLHINILSQFRQKWRSGDFRKISGHSAISAHQKKGISDKQFSMSDCKTLVLTPP